jgi:inward rectifier potassium channel
MAEDQKNKKSDSRQRRVSIGTREIVARGLDTSIWTDLYHGSLTISWPRFIGIAVAAYVALNALFGLLYALVPGAIANSDNHGPLATFFFSIETIASVGYGDMHPQSFYGHVIASIETFVGLFSIALMTGLIFARFSQPRARIVFAERPVISMHDGKPTLMMRVANARTNMVSDAAAKLWLMRNEMSGEGSRLRRFYELPLVRSENPMFIMTWSIFHVIDENSLLFGQTIEELRKADVGFILSLSGNDETSAQVIRARHSYSDSDLAWDHRYHDILEIAEDGLVTVNYHHFHKVIPVGE